jgi:hypothetical protein
MKKNKKIVAKPDFTPKNVCIVYAIAVLCILIAIYWFYVDIYSALVTFIRLPSPEDVLMYFGVAVGGLATLLAVLLTIDKEKKFREEEKKINARVRIVMDSHIRFSDFNEFLKYSSNVNISKLYCFQEWRSAFDIELPWITKPNNTSSTQPCRFAAFIVANPTDIPIYDVYINVGVEIVPIDENKQDEGQIDSKDYTPITFTVFPQQSKIAFALPVIKGMQYLAKNVKITYLTQMKEQMRYECEYFRKDDSATERYYVGDEELFNSNKKLSPFYDLRKWDR